MPRRMSTQLQAWSQPRGSKQCPVLIIPQRVRSKRKGPCKQANKYMLVPFDKLHCSAMRLRQCDSRLECNISSVMTCRCSCCRLPI